MYNIYLYNEFSRENVIEEVTNIAEELAEEQSKPIEERDKDKEFQLIYQQFIKGLKLSTGNNFYQTF